MAKTIFKAGDMIVKLIGKDKGRHGTVMMLWDPKDDIYICEFSESYNEKQAVALLKADEIALLSADNETYADRLLPSMEDFL